MQRGNCGSGKNIDTVKEELNVDLTFNILTKQIEQANKIVMKDIEKINEEIKNVIQNRNHEIQAILRKFMDRLKDNETLAKLNDGKHNKNVPANLNDSMKGVKSAPPIISPTQNLTMQSKEKKICNEKLKIKKWRYKLRTRSDLYFRYHRNKKLIQIFDIEIKKENPTLPKTFLSHLCQDDDEEEKEIKQQLTIKKVKAELQLQNIRANKQLKSLKNIDEEMCTYIQENFPKQIAQNLLKEWNMECRKREEKAERKFKQKESYFKGTWMKYEETKPDQINNAKIILKKHSSYRLPKRFDTSCYVSEDQRIKINKDISKNYLDNKSILHPSLSLTELPLEVQAENCKALLPNLMLSKQQTNFSSNNKSNSTEKNTESTSSIAKSNPLLDLLKVSRKSLKTSNIFFNREPSDFKNITSINDITAMATSNIINKMVAT